MVTPVKRIVLWLLSTLTVLVLLFGYHTSTGRSLATSAPTSIVSGSTSTSTSDDDSSGSGSTGSSAGGSTSGSRTSPASTTVTGDAAATQWGPVQVALTVNSGTITEVSLLEYPNGNPRDVEINNYALPTLIQETLDQQSADIDMVSGATVTSVGYIQSLQSALDQAGL